MTKICGKMIRISETNLKMNNVYSAHPVVPLPVQVLGFIGATRAQNRGEQVLTLQSTNVIAQSSQTRLVFVTFKRLATHDPISTKVLAPLVNKRHIRDNQRQQRLGRPRAESLYQSRGKVRLVRRS